MPSPPQWIFGPFRLDLTNACLWRRDEMLALRPKAFAVLTYLVTHAGQLVTKEALLEAVWAETAVSDMVLKASIRQIRQVLGETVETPQFIATVHRRGYRFIAPVTTVEPASPTSVQSAPAPLPLPPSSPGLQPALLSTVLVAREGVLCQLQARLAEAIQGRRRMVLVTGEPGIGKTALVTAFTAQAAAEHEIRIAWGQCVEHYGAGEAYMPVLTALGQLCRDPESLPVVGLLRQHAPTWLVQMPWLLSSADRETLQHELRGATRDRMLRELAELLDIITASKPLILVLEDLHWSDHATLDVLTMLARRRESARLLLVGTYRPAEVMGRDHPLRTVTQDLRLYEYGTELPLELLRAPAVTAYLATRLPGGQLPVELGQRLYERTGGNPLFVVKVVEHLIARGILVEQDGHWELCGPMTELEVEVPKNLRQMIAQQFDRLTSEEQQLVEVGSVRGREFSVAAVAAGCERDVQHLERVCEALVRRGAVLRSIGTIEWPDGTFSPYYAFQHALYQQVAYERLGMARRVLLHRRIGERLEQAYSSQVATLAAELAMHFARGRDYPRAVRYLQQAAEIALQRHAHQEAVDHLQHALALLSTLPDTPDRPQQELQLHLALGAPLMAIKGQAAPEVEHVYARAHTLCLQVEQTAQLLPVLAGLRRFYAVRAVHQASWDLGERLLTLAQRLDTPAFQLEAERGLGTTLLFVGQFREALAHLENAIALYAPGQLRVADVLGDPKISCLVFAARALWCLGYPAQALARSQEALALMQQLAHPYGLVWGQSFVADLYLLCGDLPTARQLAEASLAQATAQGVPYWLARGRFMYGLVLARQGNSVDGIVQMRQGLDAMQGTGAALNRVYFLAQLAEVHLLAGQTEAGLTVLAEARAMIERTGEHSWEAEVYRLQGELLCEQEKAQRTVGTKSHAAGERLQQALAIARQQQAKSLELRAAMSLCRLWQQQGKYADARQLLSTVYNWFTEGLDTADLRAATALLAAQGT
jgi:DNA-binding winged helix-turn-helix (wHTH) protein/predicted ATPase